MSSWLQAFADVIHQASGLIVIAFAVWLFFHYHDKPKGRRY